MKANKLLLLAVSSLCGYLVAYRCAGYLVSGVWEADSVAEARTCPVAEGDAQEVIDVSTVSGSGVVFSPKGAFVSGDVGKTMFVTLNGVTIIAPTTISAFTDASHVTTIGTASANVTAVLAEDGSYVGAIAVWATGDSTSAINTQVSACRAAAGNNYPVTKTFVGRSAGVVTLNGNYIVSGCIYDVSQNGPIPSIVGSGIRNTILFMTPGLTQCADGPYLIHANGHGLNLKGFTVQASGPAYGTSNNLVNIVGSRSFIIDDLGIYDFGTTSTFSSALAIHSSDYGQVSQVYVQGGQGISYLCSLSTADTVFEEMWCSNGWRNVEWAGGPGRTPASAGSVWISGGSDECGDPLRWCTYIAPGGEFQGNHLVFFSPLHVSAGASVYLTNSNVGQFNASDSFVGLDIMPGAQVFLAGTTVRGTLGGAPVHNRGTVINMGGNTYKDCSFSTCTAKTEAQAYLGNQPVKR